MGITADEVVLEFRTDTRDYDTGLSKVLTDFNSKMAALNQSAAGAGNATAVVFDKASGAFQKAGTQAQKYGKNAQVAAGQTANLAAQFQDIAVQLQSGTSPLTVALQQGTQISAVLNQIGSGSGGLGALKALAGGFMSIVNPVSLATLGIIALGGAVVQWVSGLGEEIPTADKFLKEHGELIKDLKDYYDGASESAEKYGKSAAIVLDAIARKQAAVAKKIAEEQNASFFDSTALSSRITGGSEFTIAPEFKAAEGAILTFRQQLKDGKADFDAFLSAIQNSGLSQDLKDQLINGAQGIREINEAADIKPLTDYEIAMSAVNAAVEKIDSKSAQKEIEDLAKKGVEGALTTDQVRIALEELSRANPDMAGPINALNEVIKKAREAQGAIGAVTAGGKGDRLQPEPDVTGTFLRGEGGQDLVDKLKSSNDAIIAEEERAAKAIQSAKDKAAREAERAAKKAAKEDPLERFNRRIEEQTANVQAEYNAQSQLNPLIEDYGFKLDAARLYQEGLNAAKKAGIDLSPAEMDAMKKTTEGLALLQAEQARLQDEQEKTKQSFLEWNDTAKSAVGGFLSDLQNGVGLAEALTNALNKVLDKLIEVGLNSIFDPSTGIFGGGGGFLSGIFGGARANGGPVRTGKTYLVGEKGPELFTPGAAGSIIPNSKTMASGMGPTTSNGGGLDVRFIADVDEQGNITPVVTRIAQRAAGQAVKSSQRGEVQRLPGNLQAARSRGLVK